MEAANRFAFKEWAAVCRAVAAGRQAVLVRKGGIHERRGRFAVEHDEFWLFATRFHQSDEELSPDGRSFLAEARREQPGDGFVSLPAYAVVTDVVRVGREEQIPLLRPYHVYDDRVLGERFRYKEPGLMVLVVRAFTPGEPVVIPDSPHFGGCRSWVELPGEVSTVGLRAVVSDEAFERARGEIVAAVEGSVIA
jgi:hypothetical protein